MSKQLSTFITLQVPAAASNVNPAILVRTNHSAPVRVEIKNVGGTLIFVGTSLQDVAGPDGPVTATYRIPPGDTDVLVLAVEQTLFAVAAGQGGLASLTVSEAWPSVSQS